MYKKETQLTFEDFVFPYGELDSENEWVKLAGLVPWETVEREYAKQFVDNGHPAHSARIALGALIGPSPGNVLLCDRCCPPLHESDEEAQVSLS